MNSEAEALVPKGQRRIDWAAQAMPVLRAIGKRFEKERPLEGQRIAACLHITAETGHLVRVLAAGGAKVKLTASNPLSTQDDVVAALSTINNVAVHAARGDDKEQYYRHINTALDDSPTLTVDDGADLVNLLHSARRERLPGIVGGTEETTTGVTRLQSMAKEGALTYPVIAVNNARTKHLFDNRYGTGQSTIDGILRATNRLLAGSRFVVAGYGWCGKGLAMRAAGMGAQVIVTEVDPMRALEAVMDGYRVLPMVEAAPIGDIFCTVTGNANVIDGPHMERMKDGAMLCNAGHFDVEINLDALQEMSGSKERVRDHLDAYSLKDGRRIFILGEGRLVNLAAAEGHPPDVMDLSFANQALAVEHIVRRPDRLTPGVHEVPVPIDEAIARLKLEALNTPIDTLTKHQRAYLSGWKVGT